MDKYDLTNGEDIVKRIEQASEIQLSKYISAVIRRYNVLRTDREAAFLSLSTDPKTRNKELEEIIRFICACYSKQDS